MLNFYGRKYPRKIKNDQLKSLNDFEFFLDKNKIKRFNAKIKKFKSIKLRDWLWRRRKFICSVPKKQ